MGRSTKTKAKKDWRRRKGRPSIKAERTPSGQISRAKTESVVEVTSIAHAYRRRQYGLTAEQASHEKAATVLGRLWLRKQITTPMREAGERYLEWYQDAMRAIKAPTGFAKGSAGGSAGDLVSDDYIEWAIKAVAKRDVAKHWCEPNLTIVEAVVIEDRECAPISLPKLRDRLLYLAVRMGIN